MRVLKRVVERSKEECGEKEGDRGENDFSKTPVSRERLDPDPQALRCRFLNAQQAMRDDVYFPCLGFDFWCTAILLHVMPPLRIHNLEYRSPVTPKRPACDI